MCANVRECPANVRECVRMCANAVVYLRECLRMCRECVKMLPRMFANVRVFVANVCESMPYLRMKLVTSAVAFSNGYIRQHSLDAFTAHLLLLFHSRAFRLGVY